MDELTIGALSQESGVHIVTIRYYERIGLMPGPRRGRSGYPLYGVDHLKRLNFIRRGRELGFELDDLRNLLQLVDRSYTCAEVYTQVVRHSNDIKRRIKDLRKLQRVMDDMLAQCSADETPDCPIIEALFEAKPARKRGAFEDKPS